ncbi:DUF4112 domain-containing protein [Croceicoccus estronivorus]|uniref:DUF4112 domain-containing protein n=1 Tax=Croceicoccus estronivorus TaxID=1172626 RepID=UPI000AD8C129|nr:DUF4112 domain-containing protein [Croceicoccus estronivorus]
MQQRDAARAARPARMGMQIPIGSDPHSVRQRIEAMEKVMERSFVVPGINRPIGLDAIIGLVPVAGDVIGAAMGAYIVWEARNLGLSKWKLWRMAGNIAVDTVLGAVPLAGDLFDFLFRSNSRNLRIVKRHLDKHHPASRVIDS